MHRKRKTRPGVACSFMVVTYFRKGKDGDGSCGRDSTRHISEKLEDEAFFFHLRHVLTSFRKGGGESGTGNREILSRTAGGRQMKQGR